MLADQGISRSYSSRVIWRTSKQSLGSPVFSAASARHTDGALADCNRLAGRLIDCWEVVVEVWYRTAKTDRAHTQQGSEENYMLSETHGQIRTT